MTLSEFSYYLRKYGPLAGIGFILFMLFFVILQMLFQSFTPASKPVAFNPIFGNIGKVHFTTQFDYPPNLKFELDNIHGRPITSTSSAQIYFIPKPITRFGYQQTLSFMAKAAGFDTEQVGYTLKETTATYTTEAKSLVIDIQNFNFTYEAQYKGRSDLFVQGTIPDENTILGNANQFLKNINRYPQEIATGTYNIVYFNYDPATDTFNVVPDSKTANVVEVDFYPPDIDGIPVVSPKYFNSQNYVVMTFQTEKLTVIKAQMKFYEKDLTSGAGYPVITGEEAYAQLTSGKGIIVTPVQLSTTNIVIKEMFLAYLEPDEYQQFIQPVYVFLGENNFAAYVSAVEAQYRE